MTLTFDERLSDSPFVERIWRTHSADNVPFLSVAASHWEMVVSKYQDQTTITVRGPETKVTPHECPAGGEWIGIRFKLGTIMPHLPASHLVNSNLNLPGATSQSFWLQGSAWQWPDFENADTFVQWLARDGLLVHEPVIETALQNHDNNFSPRTIQRYFQRITGLTHSTIRQIERARYAATRLQEGTSIADVAVEAGYHDQPHLNRSLQQFIGQTPTQIMRMDKQLSLLYKTTPLPCGIVS
jgi:AraC-like DNA-binding protein